MSIDVKYRVKEVAADFGVTPKEISEIVGKYYEKPKSYTQALSAEELNAVFEHITRHNQIADIAQVFDVKPKEQPKSVEAPKAEAPKAEAAPKAEPARPQQPKPQQGQPAPLRPNNNQPRPQQGQPARPAQPQQPVKAAEPERKRERRVVDTSAVQVNTNRFADVDNLVSEREQDYQGGKQKFGGKKGQQQNKKDNKFKGNTQMLFP